MHTYIHIYKYIYIYTSIPLPTHPYAYLYLHKHTRTCLYMYAYICTTTYNCINLLDPSKDGKWTFYYFTYGIRWFKGCVGLLIKEAGGTLPTVRFFPGVRSQTLMPRRGMATGHRYSRESIRSGKPYSSRSISLGPRFMYNIIPLIFVVTHV